MNCGIVAAFASGMKDVSLNCALARRWNAEAFRLEINCLGSMVRTSTDQSHCAKDCKRSRFALPCAGRIRFSTWFRARLGRLTPSYPTEFLSEICLLIPE